MALSEVIELPREMRDRIVQRWPEHGEGRIKLGAQLIVQQGQNAVFYRDGKSLDVFGPGRHTLTTANVPLLTKFISRLGFGVDSIFSANVYFVAMREFPQEGWGTRQPIAMQTPGQGLGWLLLGAHGTFGFEVSDAKRVVDTFVGGGQASLDLRAVKTRLVNAIVQAATDWFAEVNPGNLMKAQAMLDEMATAVKIKAQPQFEAMGMVLKNITIGGLSPLETSAEKLQKMGLLDANMYMQLKAMETIQEASKGGGGGSGAGMGVGLGAGMGAGAAMGQMMSGILGGQPQQSPAGQPAASSGPKEFPPIMGVTEAAEYLGVAVEDVVQLCMSGELKAKKIGSQYRISKAAIDEFMNS
ncbi:MAG: helix-turn-helix domain-containing protein [Chloroflexi bacterium]|nr:MAG: helix-turn-helix domain-containing protein [Chloroflexota bacterium]